MLNLKDINWKKPGLFAAGVAFGTAKQINEDRAAEAEAEVVDDFCETEETAEDTAEATEE